MYVIVYSIQGIGSDYIKPINMSNSASSGSDNVQLTKEDKPIPTTDELLFRFGNCQVPTITINYFSITLI